LTRIATLVACLAILAFLIVGAVFHWRWAGFDKPLYDWMQLLIIPVVLALIAVWFNRIDKKNEQAIAQQRFETEQALAKQRAEAEQALALDNQQEAALQGYLDRTQELLLHEKLRESEQDNEVRNVARMRTLTMLHQLNTRRANLMLAFLRESRLITSDIRTSIIKLSTADLRKLDLHEVALYNIDLSDTNLSDTNLK